MTHHAYLLVGGHTWALSQIPPEYAIEGPDVSILRFERMSIGDARALSHDAYIRPVTNEQRTFVVLSEGILGEAQNALLKLLEEPPATAQFYFVVPHEDTLLPTVRSRFHLLGEEVAELEEGEFKKFLLAGYAERLTIIAEKLKEEDTAWIRMVVHGAAQYAEKKQDPTLIREVLNTEQYLRSAGSSKKMLLEHLALSL